uniref:Phytosulfokine n=1 Tax=Leersia perrieri TaxID=77586 RepID=A0A0D9WV40_9ORYZ
MAAARPATVVLVAALAVLFLLSSSAMAARPEPAFDKVVSLDEEAVRAGEKEIAGECKKGEGEEECLARRTLTAHTDYIYTQEHHN